MDYITIVEKSSIQVVPNYILGISFAVLMATLLIPTIISIIIVSLHSREWVKVLYTELVAGAVSIIICILFTTWLDNYFKVDSGKYKYKVTIDTSKVTAQELEDFYIKYTPEIQDGYYYFEGEEILEEGR